MTQHVEIDFETRSDIDIRTHGSHVYFESPNAEALIASYRIDNGPIRRWQRGEPCPPELRAAIEGGAVISAHNCSFEILCLNMLADRHGWPRARLEQFRCTAATAAAMALPRALGDLGAALGLDVQKDKDGMRLIRKFSIPRRPKKDEPPGLYWHELEDHPEDFDLFKRYCDRDVETEAAADARMVPLSADEQELWVIDQRINNRGLRIDVKSARSALVMAEKAKARLDREIRLATGGYVKATTNVSQLVEWVQSQGVELESAAKADIEDLLEFDDIPAHVRRAVEIRQEAAKTSVSKLKAFLQRASRDGRIRGAFLFSAAGTRRWSSVGAQVHNLPRPRKEFGEAALDLELLFEAIRTEDPEALTFLYGEKLGRTLWLLSDSIRGFIWAAPGHDLLVADYAGIEGVVAAWFAGEDWKVKAIAEINEDPKKHPDLYRRAAAGIFNTTVEAIPKSDTRRQIGKVSELSLQYQGGPGAFRSMARNYSIKLAPVYPIVWEAASEERRNQAVKRYENAVARNEPITRLMTREEFLAGELIKIGWRASHPAIVETWSELEDGARQAVENPGLQVRVKKITYLVARGFLWCRLPSGGCLAYGSPRIKEQVWVKVKLEEGWSDVSEVMGREEAHRAAAKGLVKIERQAKSAVTALGVNSVTKKWERFALYGGLAFENVVQAIARDLLANGIRKAEAAGYPVVGHVHDEILTEVHRTFGDVKAFERLICELPDWAAGMPLIASGWRGKRYRKD